ncbi:hypothetical protein J8F10_30420 [Gemmata sp. G18]|uniref:Uncharacterized protein n=1 Tax=Gemmata palustris TaxID=2822762 RepID=A0ABS5C0R2_9BACT|nr:hypothetical protein [Gemmata palustris]MBP3959581.1 hypothetical protein [Gemmata palustris]
MKTSTPGDSPMYVVRFRPGRGRWKTVATANTHLEAVLLIHGRGDWHIIELPTIARSNDRSAK